MIDVVKHGIRRCTVRQAAGTAIIAYLVFAAAHAGLNVVEAASGDVCMYSLYPSGHLMDLHAAIGSLAPLGAIFAAAPVIAILAATAVVAAVHGIRNTVASLF